MIGVQTSPFSFIVLKVKLNFVSFVTFNVVVTIVLRVWWRGPGVAGKEILSVKYSYIFKIYHDISHPSSSFWDKKQRVSVTFAHKATCRYAIPVCQGFFFNTPNPLPSTVENMKTEPTISQNIHWDSICSLLAEVWKGSWWLSDGMKELGILKRILKRNFSFPLIGTVVYTVWLMLMIRIIWSIFVSTGATFPWCLQQRVTSHTETQRDWNQCKTLNTAYTL